MVVSPWVGLLVYSVNPLCAYHRGEPFVEVLVFVHRHAPDSACTAWLVRFDDGLEVVGSAVYVYGVAEVYGFAIAFID